MALFMLAIVLLSALVQVFALPKVSLWKVSFGIAICMIVTFLFLRPSRFTRYDAGSWGMEIVFDIALALVFAVCWVITVGTGSMILRFKNQK